MKPQLEKNKATFQRWLFAVCLATGTAATLYDNHLDSLVIQEAMEAAPIAVPMQFKVWSAVTAIDGAAVVWDGAKSAILYVQKAPHYLAETDRTRNWIVWAESSNGQLFTVSFWVDKKGALHSLPGPKMVTRNDLVQALVADGELELIKALGYPMKNA
ncbi:hypothetical protein [Acidovorax delafieldii]|uniref:hypothetical protein n=1 Tax=Acidovorax delafieldii TaxID=47920 RepID=UPI003ECE6E2D